MGVGPTDRGATDLSSACVRVFATDTSVCVFACVSDAEQCADAAASGGAQ